MQIYVCVYMYVCVHRNRGTSTDGKGFTSPGDGLWWGL